MADADGWKGFCPLSAPSPVAIKTELCTRFIPPERPDQMPGMWQRYYGRWRVVTHEPRRTQAVAARLRLNSAFCR
jgi:hypothetical protein